MSSNDAFWDIFEEHLKDYELDLKQFRNLLVQQGDGFLERYATISRIISLEKPPEKSTENLCINCEYKNLCINDFDLAESTECSGFNPTYEYAVKNFAWWNQT